MQSVHMLRIRRASPAQLAAWTPGRDETNEFSSEDKADAEKPRQLAEAAAGAILAHDPEVVAGLVPRVEAHDVLVIRDQLEGRLVPSRLSRV